MYACGVTERNSHALNKELLREAEAKQGNKLAVSDVGQFGKGLANDGLDNIQGSILQRSRPAQPQLACGLVKSVVLELQLHPF